MLLFNIPGLPVASFGQYFELIHTPNQRGKMVTQSSITGVTAKSCLGSSFLTSLLLASNFLSWGNLTAQNETVPKSLVNSLFFLLLVNQCISWKTNGWWNPKSFFWGGGRVSNVSLRVWVAMSTNRQHNLAYLVVSLVERFHHMSFRVNFPCARGNERAIQPHKCWLRYKQDQVCCLDANQPLGICPCSTSNSMVFSCKIQIFAHLYEH